MATPRTDANGRTRARARAWIWALAAPTRRRWIGIAGLKAMRVTFTCSSNDSQLFANAWRPLSDPSCWARVIVRGLVIGSRPLANFASRLAAKSRASAPCEWKWSGPLDGLLAEDEWKSFGWVIGTPWTSPQISLRGLHQKGLKNLVTLRHNL